MNVREELHSLIEGLDASEAKRRLHLFIAEMDEEAVHNVMAQVERIRRRRRLEEWGFRM